MQRRQFLKYSAGGLTLAMIHPSSLLASPGAAAAEAALTSADAVLTIGSDGVVSFTSPYTEMGQGSPTAAAQIIADALHTNLDQLQMLANDGSVAQRDEDYRNRFNGGGSGGSQSMATAWVALQDIGAVARTLLIAAAAQRFGVEPGQCSTREDQVVCGDRSASYGELAAAAAKLPLPKEPRYRDVANFRYVGKKKARADLPKILTGAPLYAIDAAMDGMLHATLIRCPGCAGEPQVGNREDVLQMPGVVGIFPLLAKEHDSRVKNAVVVVARDTWSALRARRAVRVDWQKAPTARATEADFWADLRSQLDHGDANNVQTVGDFDGVDTSGLSKFVGEYLTPHQNQTLMEPMTMVAHRDDDRIRLVLSTQFPGSARDKIAELTGLPQDNIVVENRVMGGSFGRRAVPDCLVETVLVADKLRRPVKVMWTREDDTQHGQYRNASLSRVRAHLDDAGEIRRWLHQTVQTHPTDPARIQSLAYGMSDMPYDLQAARFEIHGIRGDVHLGPMRSPPHPLKYFAVSTFIDELAHRQNVDPIDLHIRLIKQPRDIELADWLVNHGHTDNTGTHIELARRVRDASGWDDRAPAGVGRGFSSGFIFGTHIAMVVEVVWRNQRIELKRATCVVDCGRVINPDIARQQVEGGLIYGLSSAMGEVITTHEGAVQQANFDSYPLLRFAQSPRIDVEFVTSAARPSGLGEPPTPPAYAALGNAIFAASGKRIREIPFARHIDFA